MSGYIKLFRSLLDWEWYDDMPCRTLFIHCLLKANRFDKYHKGDLIKSGSFVTSRQLLSFETGLSEKSIRTALERLEKTGELGSKRARKGTVVTVIKYRDFQEDRSEGANEGPEKGSQKGRNASVEITSKGSSNKKGKKEKNIKEGGRKVFSKPSLVEISEYGKTLKPQFSESETFFDYYEATGWRVGNSPMKDWKATVRNWNRRRSTQTSPLNTPAQNPNQYD